MISMIFAMDRNGLIGKGNRIPWRIPADLQYFKQITLGHTVIMGRKTYESIGFPLPERKNIILTKNLDFIAEGCHIIHSADEIIDLTKNEEVFIIGGKEIYSEFLHYADKLYMTHIDYDFEGDTFFPRINFEEWNLVYEKKGIIDEKNPYNYYFRLYDRKNR